MLLSHKTVPGSDWRHGSIVINMFLAQNERRQTRLSHANAIWLGRKGAHRPPVRSWRSRLTLAAGQSGVVHRPNRASLSEIAVDRRRHFETVST